MKLILALTILFASSVAQAAGADPFDPNSCAGPMMSAKRALELMGQHSLYNLAKNTPGDVVNGVARTRQKLGGETGTWFQTNGEAPFTPYIQNDSGKLGFQIYYRTYINSGYTNAPMDCQLHDSAFLCTPTREDSPIASGSFIVTITDHCFRAFSTASDAGRDTEWAYLLNF